MTYYIRFSDKIKRIMINHTFEKPEQECGGFLYGNLTVKDDKTICDVDEIYFERTVGNDCHFNFGFMYIYRGYIKAFEPNFGNLIGTYHSHGNYSAELSDVDHNELQKYFGANKITVVYSPKYSQIVGEFLDEKGESHKAKILTKNKINKN